MIRSIKYLAAAGMFAVFAGGAQAAPANLGNAGTGVTDGLVKVHRGHRQCERDRRGWHRHNRYNERRRCREWRGRGRRPDSCVKFGPVWYCEY
jgi:hypothetical protein